MNKKLKIKILTDGEVGFVEEYDLFVLLLDEDVDGDVRAVGTAASVQQLGGVEAIIAGTHIHREGPVAHPVQAPVYQQLAGLPVQTKQITGGCKHTTNKAIVDSGLCSR